MQLVFLKCWQQKQLYSGITSFKEHLLLATTPYNKGFFLLNVTCCSRLWASSFIYFKSTRVFFYLMFLMDVLLQLKKEIRKAMCVLWFDVFNELSSSIKEINGLIWKVMSNIYYWEKLFSKLRFSRKENLKKCTNFEEQIGTRYIWGNVYLALSSSTVFRLQSCLRFFWNCFVREIKGFYQSYYGNENDFRDIMKVSPNIFANN